MPSSLVQSAPQLARWVVAPDGWRDAWDAAKAACLTTPAWCTFFGDSNPYGLGCTNVMSTSLPELLRNYWRNTLGYPWYADYWPLTYSNDFHVQSFGLSPPGTQPWVVVATGTINHSWTVYGLLRTYWANAAISATTYATFTTPYATYTQMELVYLNWFSGTWTYTDPGSTRRTVTDTGTTKDQKVSTGMTGMAATNHTVKLDGMTMNSTFPISMVSGINCYEHTNQGIGMGRIIATGGGFAEMTINPGIPNDQYSQFANSSITTPGVASGFTFPTQGALFVVMMGVNDCQQDRGIAFTQDGLRRAFSAARRGYANCSLLLILAYHPDMAYSDQVTGWTDWQNWNLYCRALREVANEFGACIVDLHAKWGMLAYTNGLLKSSADPHMNDAGTLDLFNLLVSPAVGI